MSAIAPAATLVLAREPARAPGTSPEICFVRRHGNSAFMANAWVFPGGRLDVLDRDVRALERVRGLDPGRLLGRMHGVSDPDEALGLAICALRETFEEAGVLLATARDGRGPDRAALAEARVALNAGTRSFPAILDELDLWLDGGALTYFDHWITPPVERRRYDTRFFVARAPADQEAAHDAAETTDAWWADPTRALSRHASSEDFALSPPTFWIVGDLADRADLGDVERWAAAREVPPVRPAVVSVDGRMGIALPGDPLHPGGAVDGAAPRRMVWNGAAWIRG